MDAIFVTLLLFQPEVPRRRLKLSALWNMEFIFVTELVSKASVAVLPLLKLVASRNMDAIVVTLEVSKVMGVLKLVAR